MRSTSWGSGCAIDTNSMDIYHGYVTQTQNELRCGKFVLRIAPCRSENAFRHGAGFGIGEK
jgi:hypothetical protein